MEFYGLVGEKLSHSLSPEIHKRIFEQLNIDGGYKLFEIPKEDIGKLGHALKLLKIKGVNVTIPYKEVVMRDLDFISEEAEEIGAINTILNKDNKLYGYNSDYYGFGSMLDINEIKLKDKVATVLGNGGAAKAIITYLLDKGIKDLYLVTRNKENNENINPKVKLIDYEDIKKIGGDILINTTPVGMYPKIGVSPVSKEVIEKYNTLVDIVYNPGMTEFLKIGKTLGKNICGGLYMLVGQGVKSQEIWQDIKIDSSVLQNIYEELEKQFK